MAVGPGADRSKTLSTATWDPVFQRAFVHTQRGQSCATVGMTQRRTVGGVKSPATLELYPEEAAYLIERGALDCRWTLHPGTVPSGEDHARSVPISALQAYTKLLGTDGSSLARYQVRVAKGGAHRRSTRT